MKSHKTLILSAILLVLLSVAVYQMKQPPAVANDADSTAVIGISPDEDLTGLVFYNQNDYVTLKRNGEAWRLETPFAAPADAQKIETFVRTSFGLHYIRKLTDGISDPASFGLKQRSRFCIFSYSSGRSDTLFLGGTTPVGSWYLRKNSENAIYTVAQEFGEYFQRKASDWRMFRLGDWPIFGVSAITIKTPKEDILFAKDSLDLSWTITAPRRWPGDHPAIVGLLRTIFETHALEIRPIASFPAKAAFSVAIENDQGGRLQVLAQPDKKECLVTVNGGSEVYVMPPEFGAALSRNWNLYRDRRLVRELSVDSVSRVVVSDDGSPLSVARQNSGEWALLKPKSGPADGKAVKEFLAGLAALSADSIMDSRKDAAHGGRRLDVMLEQGRSLHQLHQKILFVVTNGKTNVYTDGACFMFGTDIIRELWKGAEYFRK